MEKDTIVYGIIAIIGVILSSIFSIILKLHIKALSLCCGIITLTRSISSRASSIAGAICAPLSLFGTTRRTSGEISDNKIISISI
jgi:hypothetical protein